ncbi:hypothetical protein WNZ14_16020 [Hoeflea sp. AS60]
MAMMTGFADLVLRRMELSKACDTRRWPPAKTGSGERMVGLDRGLDRI